MISASEAKKSSCWFAKEQILFISQAYYFRIFPNTVPLNNERRFQVSPPPRNNRQWNQEKTFASNVNVCSWIRKLTWFYPIWYIKVRGNTPFLWQTLSFYMLKPSCVLVAILSGGVREPSYGSLQNALAYFSHGNLKGCFLLLLLLAAFFTY